MALDHITEVTIEGLRSIERLTLPLRGLTVLIGENATGKSSIVEACEILRRTGSTAFLGELSQIHGGMFNLLRLGASCLTLGIRVEGGAEDAPLRYQVSIGDRRPGAPAVLQERLEESTSGGTRAIFDRTEVASPLAYPHETVVSQPRDASSPACERVRAVLSGIEVHLPFEVVPSWAARAHHRASAMRTTGLLQATDRLDRLGANLANAYHALRMEHGEEHWQTTLDYVRLGLGDHVESVTTRADAGGGAIALWLKLRGRDQQLPAAALADGTLAYLAFVALYRLRRDRSLLVFDEPDLHLHPALLGRVTGFFEAMAEDGPVLITTHSDRLLDSLRDPAAVVRVAELSEPEQATRVRALDRDALDAWLAEYRGVGELRSAGYLSAVLKPEGQA